MVVVVVARVVDVLEGIVVVEDDGLDVTVVEEETVVVVDSATVVVVVDGSRVVVVVDSVVVVVGFASLAAPAVPETATSVATTTSPSTRRIPSLSEDRGEGWRRRRLLGRAKKSEPLRFRCLPLIGGSSRRQTSISPP
ncbi:MAG TPA: hypothetical protein VEB69_01580 [Acidimicrobiia bacterium]|nr:hypothetical protein [Acidimicrobiia bacterium]